MNLTDKARKLIDEVAPSHQSLHLVEDMVQAAHLWALKHPGAKRETLHLDLRNAMLDELCLWIVGVTAHQHARTVIHVEWQDWISEWTMISRDRVERQVMARAALRKIFELAARKRGTRGSPDLTPNSVEAILASGDFVSRAEREAHGTTVNALANARGKIRAVIKDHFL